MQQHGPVNAQTLEGACVRCVHASPSSPGTSASCPVPAAAPLQTLNPDLFARPCSLRPLFVVLNDEYVVVQALAIRVVGRLANSNPAYVMPALRRHLMQLLNDMDCSPDLRQREGEGSGVGFSLRGAGKCWRGPLVPARLTTMLDIGQAVHVLAYLFRPLLVTCALCTHPQQTA